MISRKDSVKEDKAVVLDFLPHGYPFDKRPMHKKTPIAQAIGKDHFMLLELVPKKGITLQPTEEIYIGEGKRDKIHHIIGKIPVSKLTETAKGELDYVVADLVEKKEDSFVKFFNESGSISTRMHAIELLPGIGKKQMWQIIEQRKENPFKSFDDIKKRIKIMASPKKAVVRRILSELNEEDKYRLFIK